jgi:hypothetical protein
MWTNFSFDTIYSLLFSISIFNLTGDCIASFNGCLVAWLVSPDYQQHREMKNEAQARQMKGCCRTVQFHPVNPVVMNKCEFSF